MCPTEPRLLSTSLLDTHLQIPIAFSIAQFSSTLWRGSLNGQTLDSTILTEGASLL